MAHGGIVRQSVRGSRRWPSRQYQDGLPRRACDLRKRDARRVRRSPPRSAPADPLLRAVHSSQIDDPEVPVRPLGSLANPRVEPTLLSCRASGKVPETHSVDSICDHDFGVFTVTNIATENTDAVLPAHPLPRTPKAANQGLQRCRGPSVPLTCLAPLAAWQSLCTGHVDASLENSVALASPPGTARAPAAATSVSLASEGSPP